MVRIITLVGRLDAAILRVVSTPSITGMRMSMRATSTSMVRSFSNASAPFDASPTTAMSSSESMSMRNPERTRD